MGNSKITNTGSTGNLIFMFMPVQGWADKGHSNMQFLPTLGNFCLMFFVCLFVCLFACLFKFLLHCLFVCYDFFVCFSFYACFKMAAFLY